MRKHKSLAVNVIVIFLIFNIFSLAFFTLYIQHNGQSQSTEYAKKSSLEVIKEKSELISIAFDRIYSQVSLIGVYMNERMREDADTELSDEYVITADGTLTRKRDLNKSVDEQSNIILPKTTPLSKELIREINITESLDEYFKEVTAEEYTTWCYIVTKDNLLRCSPYTDLNTMFDNAHSQINDTFYTTADDENNPEHKAVWTDPYFDYLGTGWTRTCSQPLYEDNGELFGVICLDLSITKMKEKYFDGFSLGESGKICWMSNDGQMFYHTDYENVTAGQGEMFEKNIFDMNISDERADVLRNDVVKNESGISTFTENGNQILLVYAQIKDTDSVLFMEIEMNEFTLIYDIGADGIAVIFFLDLALTIIFAFLLYNQFSKPMGELVKQAERISQGNYSSIPKNETNQSGYYEIVRLNEAFGTMNESIQKAMLMEKELQQIEKMAGVGQLSAAIVHELKNILALIKGAAYILQKTTTEGKDEVRTIQNAVSEAENVITTLLDFSGKDKDGSEMIHIGTVINQILLLSKKEIIRKGICVTKKIDVKCYVNSNNREAVKVILQNIIINAIQAVDFNGQIEIGCCQRDDDVVIHIKDNGPGIKVSPKEKIFEPFVSTKDNGNGIGLWITKRLVDSLGGKILVNDEEAGETEFTIFIPAEARKDA